MTTMFETLGNRCALCALEPRVELVSQKAPPRLGGEFASTLHTGLSWQEVFALGWFLGRYTTEESASYCSVHRVRIEELRKLLAKVGVVSLHSVSLLAEPPDVDR